MKQILSSIFLIIALFGASHSVSGIAVAAVDPVVLERIRTEALRAWRAAEREIPSIDVTFTFEVSSGPCGKLETDYRQTFRLAWDPNRACKLLRTQRDGFPGAISHDVFNPQYTFKVSCPDQRERGNLLEIHVRSLGDSTQSATLPRAEVELRSFHTGSYYFATPLREFVNIQEFEPIEAAIVKDKSRELIRFTTRYIGSKAPQRGKNRIYSLVIDPEHQYRVVQGALDYQTGSGEFLFSYHDSDDILIPKEIVCMYTDADHCERQVYSIGIPSPCTIANEEFYLPHYGFSESVLDTLTPNPWPRWLLIVGGVVSLVVGAWLIKERRHRL